jgi:hypothetical protein
LKIENLQEFIEFWQFYKFFFCLIGFILIS